VSVELSDDLSTDYVDNIDGKVRESDGEKWAGTVELHFEDGTVEPQIFSESDVGRKPPKCEHAFAVAGNDWLK
jgi:hypothetical protein